MIKSDMFYYPTLEILVDEASMVHPKYQRFFYLSIPGLLAGCTVWNTSCCIIFFSYDWPDTLGVSTILKSNIFSLSGPEESQQLPILATFPCMDNLYSHQVQQRSQKFVLLQCQILSRVVFTLLDNTQVCKQIFYNTKSSANKKPFGISERKLWRLLLW
jgi:hypothetical protein